MQNPEGGRALSSALLLLTSTLELKSPVPGGFPFSYNCPVTSFMSFVKCHYSPLTTLPKGTLAPVGSAPYPALYQFPSCIIFYMTTLYIFLHGQSLTLTINSMETGIIVHCVYFCVLCPGMCSGSCRPIITEHTSKGMNLAFRFVLALSSHGSGCLLMSSDFSKATMSVFEAMPFFGAGLFCAVLISDGFDFY